MAAEAESGRDPQFASTLAKGLDILLAFRPGETLLGNRELVLRTGLSKSAVARLTHTLTVLGYLRHERALGKYRLGAAVLASGYPLLAGMHIRQVARPLMKALADELGGAVSLGVRDRTQMLYVETARSTEELLTAPDIGAAVPMLSTAIGRAWLCRCGAAEREAVLNRLRLHDAEAVRRAMPALAAARESLERRGFCSSPAEWHPDVYGFATPLCAQVDSQWFVLNCAVHRKRGRFATVEAQAGARLAALAHGLERLLGLR
ncbi:IclR family transcriptional regulator [Cupriavidus sp. USMAA2-4]|uniref:IclR family transcriptional regulator n=1 Tax=unclassified Cupriavidus TaxID=2640874 RepID=UPI0008A6A4B3|nr:MULTISPECIES: IclR family transcriptional regulator [unclassified Cupriavidus]AOY95054.1 IclR family transcriptional regulator [Cupriavidus sp. USMAA2-4]AOZ02051.1 IclR family transcriptional regulator [Cupriavidus sp. USMAHM13]